MTHGFVERGHTVIGCGRSANAIDSLRSEYGDPHRFDTLNVADDSAVQVWAADVLSAYGPPDLLSHNAALVNRNAPLWEVPVEEFSDVIDVNIKGVNNLIRHFLPAMIERG
jgi:NADP-dependent 3-hydroxy acid dehydrogenase YdfG